jgi:hydantoinase/carbamoylase family amidase
MKIDIDRLEKNLMQLAEIGNDKDGGVTRLAFTPEYRAANDFVKNLMIEAGMTVRQDPAGNLFGRYEGKENKQSILIGSHIDTVPDGGKFDGCLGVLGALECAQTLKDEGYVNKHTIEVAAWIAEEYTEIGSCFGSRCVTGDIRIGEKEKLFLNKIGLTEEDVLNSRRSPDETKCYIELHIEQGGILDTEKKSIGVVTGIAGISRYKAEMTGESNHSGSTPMNLRNDALVKASRFVQFFDATVREIGAPLVGTIGIFEVEPGAVNVIPGRINFHIELRDVDIARVRQAVSLIEDFDPDFSFSQYQYEREVLLDPIIQTAVTEGCEKLAYSYRSMHSGAGHDASILSAIVPTGMIFVPSVGGISPSPLEHTEWEDIEKGTNVLLETIQRLDA